MPQLPSLTSSILTQVTAPKGLTFDAYHGVGNLSDDLLLLFGCEHVFDDLHVYEWHCYYLL